MTRHTPKDSFELPPSIHLKMALDFLYTRALQLNLQNTALLIGSAALSAEQEGLSLTKCATKKSPADG